jgi:hypothetical protein
VSAPYYADESVTLWHGDCREVTEWLEADVLVTDPPYGMAYVSGWVAANPVAGDEDSGLREKVLARWGGRPALVFGTWRVSRPPDTRQVITWWKRKVGPGMGDLSLPWGTATEEIYVLGSGWHGARRANVIVTDDQRGNPHGLSARVGHPTPKPVGLMAQLIQCAPPGAVADPFAGSGATLLAARAEGRRAIGVEIEERYCEVIAQRLAQGDLFGGAA